MTTLANVTATITASVRSNFAIHHLRAATQAARDAYKVEQANLITEHGPWFDEIMLSVPVSVIMAAAALEANANEIIQDIFDGFTELHPAKGCKLLLVDIKKERSGSVMDKYRRLALLLDKQPQGNTQPWQDAKLLVEFRNSFMHFKPAWSYEATTHDGSLVKRLKGKIPIYRAYRANFQFPYGFLTYGCAKWSVETVLAFSADFSAALGVKDRFAAGHLDFSLR
jgi:hypothetical protein